MKIINNLISFFQQKLIIEEIEKKFSNYKIGSFIFLILFALVIGIGLFKYRSIGYENVPSSADILDERVYVHAGITFMQSGIPTGWANLSSYRFLEHSKSKPNLHFDGMQITAEGEKPSLSNISKYNYPVAVDGAVFMIRKGGETITFVQPFLDKSPLGGMFYGLGITDTQKFNDLDPKDYRQPALLLAVFTGVLITILSYLLYRSFFTAVFSLLIYLTVPSYVFSSRYALLENIIIPLSIIAIIFLYLARNKVKTADLSMKLLLISAGISTGLAILTKQNGISVFITGIALLIIYKASVKNYLYYVVPSVIVGSLFYLYSFYITPDLALQVFLNQTDYKFFGSLNFLYSVIHLHFHRFPLDGYWVFGFISVVLLATSIISNREILIGFAATLFIFLLFGGVSYPWYSLPFIPFMVISTGKVLTNLLCKPTALVLIIFGLFVFSSSLYWGYMVQRSDTDHTLLYRVLIMIFLMTAIFFENFWKKSVPFKSKYLTLNIWSLAFLIVLLVLIQWNIKGILFMVEQWFSLPEPFYIR